MSPSSGERQKSSVYSFGKKSMKSVMECLSMKRLLNSGKGHRISCKERFEGSDLKVNSLRVAAEARSIVLNKGAMDFV